VRHAKILRYRPDHRDLIVQAGVGWEKDIIGRAVAPARRMSPDGRAFVSRKPVLITDLRKRRDFKLPRIYPDHHIVSSVNVIIPGRGNRPYGVLEADSTSAGQFDRYDIDFLTSLANLVAEAITLSERMAELRSANAAKDKALAEKDTLTVELQHRIRNHLQFVQHFLQTRAAEVTDNGIRRDIEEIAGRVMTLGTIYDQLLGVGMADQIRLDEYLKSLCQGIEGFNAAVRNGVKIVCRLDKLPLDIDRTTIIGIIMNELISNCYEHAFPEGRGRIQVELQRPARGKTARLVVADNGSGFAENPESSRRGVGLVRRLAEQIAGTATLQTQKGARWEITFPTG
jgi:two-component sensor histidine kinase